MIIDYHRKFDKAFEKLTNDHQLKTIAAINKFCTDPKDPSLHVHKLHGRLSDRYAFSVTGNIRVIFRYTGKSIVLLLDIGGHDQVY